MGVNRRHFLRLAVSGTATLLAACGRPLALPGAASTTSPATPSAVPTSVVDLPLVVASTTATAAPPATATAPTITRIAVIGDFGWAGDPEQQVATLVQSWHPNAIITTGDNNYPDGAASTIDANIGQYYHEYIGEYQGGYGEGAAQNRFFPVLGNHDWVSPGAQPYLAYFALPDNEHYYTTQIGPVAMFALDTTPGAPGLSGGADGEQGRWLQNALASSSACWKIVVTHHPPFSSGLHGPSNWMQWPYKQWGADLVLSGHDHSYERFVIDGMIYVVNGLGGAPRYDRQTNQPGSVLFYNAAHGAIQLEAEGTTLISRFYTADNTLIDEFRIEKACG